MARPKGSKNKPKYKISPSRVGGHIKRDIKRERNCKCKYETEDDRPITIKDITRVLGLLFYIGLLIILIILNIWGLIDLNEEINITLFSENYGMLGFLFMEVGIIIIVSVMMIILLSLMIRHPDLFD